MSAITPNATSGNAGRMHACGHDGQWTWAGACPKQFESELATGVINKLIFQPAERQRARAMVTGVVDDVDILNRRNIGTGVACGCAIVACARFYGKINLTRTSSHWIGRSRRWQAKSGRSCHKAKVHKQFLHCLPHRRRCASRGTGVIPQRCCGKTT